MLSFVPTILVAFVILAEYASCGDCTDNWWTAFGGSDVHSGFKNDVLGNVTTVRQIWSVAILGPSLSYPLIYNGTVYVMTDGGVLRAYNESTGNSSKFLNLGGDGFIGPPTIDASGELLYVQYDNNKGHTLYAVDLVNPLRIKWAANLTGSKSSYGVVSSKAKSTVYTPNEGYRVYTVVGLNSSNGAQLFQSAPIPNSEWCSQWGLAVYQDERVFFADCKFIGELDGASGDVIWKYAMRSSAEGLNAVPVISAGVAISVMYNTRELIALTAVNISSPDTELWVSDVCKIPFRGDDLSVDDNNVFLVCDDGVHAFDMLTGLVVKTYAPCSGCFGQALITADHVVVKSDTGVKVFQKISESLVAASADSVEAIAYHAGKLFATKASTLVAYKLE